MLGLLSKEDQNRSEDDYRKPIKDILSIEKLKTCKGLLFKEDLNRVQGIPIRYHVQRWLLTDLPFIVDVNRVFFPHKTFKEPSVQKKNLPIDDLQHVHYPLKTCQESSVDRRPFK